jgi:hypothetical protein
MSIPSSLMTVITPEASVAGLGPPLDTLEPVSPVVPQKG